MQIWYEIIWVSDEMVFMNLIQRSLPMTYQHQIWIDDKFLKIAHVNPSTKATEYLYLDRA